MKKGIFKLLSVMLALVLAFSLSACDSKKDTTDSTDTTKAEPDVQGNAGEDKTSSNERPIVGVSINALDEHQSSWIDFLKKSADVENIELVILNAEGKVEKQLADVESLITQKVDLIIIRAVDSEGTVPAFEACAAANIPTIDSAFGVNYTDTLKITSSQYEVAKKQADYLIDYLDKNPEATLKCGYLWGAQGVSAVQDRYDGWKEPLLAAYPDRVEIVVEKVANWSAVESMAAVEDWMQAYPEINCIVAMSDEMAIAATNVIRASGKTAEDFIVVGIDGSENAQELIRTNVLNASVYGSRRKDAQITIDYTMRILGGEDLNGEAIDIGDETNALMTADNIDQVLVDFG